MVQKIRLQVARASAFYLGLVYGSIKLRVLKRVTFIKISIGVCRRRLLSGWHSCAGSFVIIIKFLKSCAWKSC
ncbi:hypothetical protein ABKV19_005159 [Rosa sericea]